VWESVFDRVCKSARERVRGACGGPACGSARECVGKSVRQRVGGAFGERVWESKRGCQTTACESVSGSV
jgi:hypothetical protein